MTVGERRQATMGRPLERQVNEPGWPDQTAANDVDRVHHRSDDRRDRADKPP
jgi:hypothetical protein